MELICGSEDELGYIDIMIKRCGTSVLDIRCASIRRSPYLGPLITIISLQKTPNGP